MQSTRGALRSSLFLRRTREFVCRAPASVSRVLAGYAAAASLASATALAIEGDPVAGKRKTVTCNACHGVSGFKSMPKLGGQSAGYTVEALRAYKAGRRTHATMRDVAGALSEKDIADLAAHYSAMPRTAPVADEDLPVHGQPCTACHGARGDEPATPGVPLLAGQNSAYVELALREYRDGARVHAVMHEQSRNLTDAEISGIAAYFARRGALSVK